MPCRRVPCPIATRCDTQSPSSQHSPLSWLSDRLHKGATLSPGAKSASLGTLDRAPASPQALQGSGIRAFSIPAYSPRLAGPSASWTLGGGALPHHGGGHTVHTVRAEGDA